MDTPSRVRITILITIVIFALLPFIEFPGNIYIESIELGGEWFLNNQNDNFLHYEYNAFNRAYSESSHALREMAAMWSIAELGDFLNDSRYTELAKRGFDYFEQHFVYDKVNNMYYVNVTPRKVKLGYSAFAILALLNIEHPKKEQYLEGFANGIMIQQNNGGSLSTFFFSNDAGSADYYPGEALFALMSLYEYSKNQDYLSTVGKAFPYYADYWRANKSTAFVPWQTRAYALLYQETKNPELRDFVFEMNDWMLNEHYPAGECQNFDFRRGIVTAVYMEGVNKAYELAREANDKKRMGCYARFVGEGADYIISLQARNKRKFGETAIGGFLGSYTSRTMRVDRNQHAVLALMGAIDAGIIPTQT